MDVRKMSGLDLVIVSKNLMEFVDRVEIDSKRKITPFKAERDGSLNFTDHYACLLTFKGIPLKATKLKIGAPRAIKWNTTAK